MRKGILEAARQCAAFGSNEYTLCYYCPNKSKPETCQEIFAKAIIEQHERYGWHDLRKDPDDLPKTKGVYIGCVENPRNHQRTTGEIALYDITATGFYIWKRKRGFVQHQNVVAWREIEQFEGGE